MTKENFNETFFEDLAAILEAEPGELTFDFPLHNDNWNSLAIVSAIVLLDEHFGIAIPGEKLRSCTTIGELIQMIKEARGERT
jgi:acyl carrier protein